MSAKKSWTEPSYIWDDEDDLNPWWYIPIVIIGMLVIAPLIWILFLCGFSFWLWILGLGEATFLETLRQTVDSNRLPF